jgi:hypothetical protein
MSKKLIAVAAAAALALTGLVGITPANATALSIAVLGNGATPSGQDASDGTLATKALSVHVPSNDVIRFGTEPAASNTTSTSIRLTVTKSSATATLTLTPSTGVRLFTATAFADSPTVAKGSTVAITDSANSATATFYAITTTTAAGSVLVADSGGSSQTVWIKGLSRTPYKMALTAPATAPLSGEFAITGKIQDAFGNDLTTALDISSGFTITPVGATLVTTATKTLYSSTAKTYTWTFTAPDKATGTAVQISLGGAFTPTAVTAFGTPVSSQFFTVNAVDLASQVTALTAQVAALSAQITALTDEYNKLATRFNKRVTLKKAPTKKVVLK